MKGILLKVEMERSWRKESKIKEKEPPTFSSYGSDNLNRLLAFSRITWSIGRLKTRESFCEDVKLRGFLMNVQT